MTTPLIRLELFNLKGHRGGLADGGWWRLAGVVDEVEIVSLVVELTDAPELQGVPVEIQAGEGRSYARELVPHPEKPSRPGLTWWIHDLDPRFTVKPPQFFMFRIPELPGAWMKAAIMARKVS